MKAAIAFRGALASGGSFAGEPLGTIDRFAEDSDGVWAAGAVLVPRTYRRRSADRRSTAMARSRVPNGHNSQRYAPLVKIGWTAKPTAWRPAWRFAPASLRSVASTRPTWCPSLAWAP